MPSANEYSLLYIRIYAIQRRRDNDDEGDYVDGGGGVKQSAFVQYECDSSLAVRDTFSSYLCIHIRSTKHI